MPRAARRRPRAESLAAPPRKARRRKSAKTPARAPNSTPILRRPPDALPRQRGARARATHPTGAATPAGDLRADRKDAAAGGGAEPAGGRLPSGDHGTKRAATAEKTVSPSPDAAPDPREALRRELYRWSACRTFVHQFSLIAKPKPRAVKRKWGRGGDGHRQLRLWRSRRVRERKLGLVATKHAQAEARAKAARAAQTEQQGRAFVALAHVVADAGGGGWPEAMQRELQFSRTPQERSAWVEKWREVLGGGQAERDRRGPARPAAHVARESPPSHRS